MPAEGDDALAAAAGAPLGGTPYDESAGDEASAGFGEAIGDARAAFMRLLGAHIELLKAELSLAGRELAIIVGLGAAALGLAFLIGILLFVGTWLFLGEWLFGSMGWGILHGTLTTLALIVGIGLNLAGGSMGAYGRGFLVGLVTTVVLSLLFASNVLREAAVAAAVELEDAIPLHPNLLPTLVGLVVGLVVIGLVALVAARASGARVPAAIAGAIVGAVVGAILGSVTFDIAGAVAVSLTIGLLTWMAAAAGLAAQRGFDPESRYAVLIPRGTMAAFERTRDFAMEQFERQKERFVGR